ncbi:PREDICTED: nuclear receptor coactivator 2-like [Priapulus caudatus]|uniref:Nuclear receptor coactivator 2-like n=1 Tax=Priapulus caudatus TaxID=37621 RepID=A0ABM1DQG4_PRICU|nr:PREDICTED: nuclear receptor coactivator 2-like [Priapulus caudatus]
MNSANAEATSCKRRKPSDVKLQSNVEKCLKEKNRRDQENGYIEELAELISSSIGDMNTFSLKPDKCAVLQETVKQIRRIRDQVGSGSSDAVQESDVSSSKRTILANDVLGPLLLEALNGFLFVVNSEGRIEFVSDNVTSFLKFTQDDLLGNSVYSIVHHDDHNLFNSSLIQLSITDKEVNWLSSENSNSKSRSFNCRLLLKLDGRGRDENTGMELQHRQVSPQYESMQISAVPLPYSGDKSDEESLGSEESASLVCVARKIPPNEQKIELTGPLGVEQFTTQQDTSGKILALDATKVTSNQYLIKDLVGRQIQDFYHISDVPRLLQHRQEVRRTGKSISGLYRFASPRTSTCFVQTTSKLFSSQVNVEPEFIISTHSIIRDNDVALSLQKRRAAFQAAENSGDVVNSATTAWRAAAPPGGIRRLSLAQLELGRVRGKRQRRQMNDDAARRAASAHSTTPIGDRGRQRPVGEFGPDDLTFDLNFLTVPANYADGGGPSGAPAALRRRGARRRAATSAAAVGVRATQ